MIQYIVKFNNTNQANSKKNERMYPIRTFATIFAIQRFFQVVGYSVCRGTADNVTARFLC